VVNTDISGGRRVVLVDDGERDTRSDGAAALDDHVLHAGLRPHVQDAEAEYQILIVASTLITQIPLCIPQKLFCTDKKCFYIHIYDSEMSFKPGAEK
jgi:hypothetical protein